mmetsp:Transcript_95360/g.199496  ORF Transcript_95360/g.199496 Transcript_95360/m.199496 type:complete len:362 (+) Transcript_95360:131-1216(+)
MPAEEIPELELRTYVPKRILGKGSFGVVYQATIAETQETVAIKTMRIKSTSPTTFVQPDNTKEREVQILKELDGHPNVVSLKGAFLSTDGDETKLIVVLEFLSDTLHRVLKHSNAIKRPLDITYARLYMYQLVRGLGFFHGKGIVHCDLKPQNLLLDGLSHTLKICDFGTAKRLTLGHTSSAYCCSRYYRAPELILGNISYTTAVDVWSAGCVFAEMIIGQPLFTGNDGIDQLVQIVKVMGTPTKEDVQAMNPAYPAHQFQPALPAIPWDRVCRQFATQEAAELLDALLKYNPDQRLAPLAALQHRYFDYLRAAADQSLPCPDSNLFDFLPEEIAWCTQQQKEKLIPRWYNSKRRRVETVG